MLTLLAGAGCSRRPYIEWDVEVYNVTGVVRIANFDKEYEDTAWDSLFNTANRLLPKLDPKNKDGDIAAINGLQEDARWPAPVDVFRLLLLANYYSGFTDGAFDITVAPLRSLWGVESRTPPAEPPDEEAILATLPSVGAKLLNLGDDGTVSFASPIAGIHLGPLTDAYVVDSSIVLMRGYGATNVYVKLGTARRAAGRPKAKTYWTEPIPDPAGSTNSIGRVDLRGNSSVVILQRRDSLFRIGDEYFSTQFDPRTGRPATGTALVVVIGPTCTKSSALAQALLVSGLDGAPGLLGKFPRHDALIIPEETPTTAWMSKGFADRFVEEPGFSLTKKVIETLPATVTPAPDSSANRPSSTL